MSVPGAPPEPPPTPKPRLPNPPPWFFAAIGAAVLAAVIIFVVRSGDDGSSVLASPSPSVTPTQSSVSPTPSSSPTPSPSLTTGATGATASTGVTGGTGASGPTGEAIVLSGDCFNARGGYGMSYPAGWFTPTERAWSCQLFDPVSFVVQPDTEPPIVAVSAYTEDYPMDELLAALTDPAYYEVVSTETGTFADAGRPGAVVETVQTEELFFPAGTRTYSVLVDLLDRTIVVTTNDLAATDYEQNKRIVLAMAQSLSVAG